MQNFPEVPFTNHPEKKNQSELIDRLKHLADFIEKFSKNIDSIMNSQQPSHIGYTYNRLRPLIEDSIGILSSYETDNNKDEIERIRVIFRSLLSIEVSRGVSTEELNKFVEEMTQISEKLSIPPKEDSQKFLGIS